MRSHGALPTNTCWNIVFKTSAHRGIYVDSGNLCGCQKGLAHPSADVIMLHLGRVRLPQVHLGSGQALHWEIANFVGTESELSRLHTYRGSRTRGAISRFEMRLQGYVQGDVAVCCGRHIEGYFCVAEALPLSAQVSCRCGTVITDRMHQCTLHPARSSSIDHCRKLFLEAHHSVEGTDRHSTLDGLQN